MHAGHLLHDLLYFGSSKVKKALLHSIWLLEHWAHGATKAFLANFPPINSIQVIFICTAFFFLQHTTSQKDQENITFRLGRNLRQKLLGRTDNNNNNNTTTICITTTNNNNNDNQRIIIHAWNSYIQIYKGRVQLHCQKALGDYCCVLILNTLW